MRSLFTRAFIKPHLWLIRVVGVIVPRRLRSDWQQEWEAELRYREELLAEWDKLNWQTKLDLLRRSSSACWDALWLQPRRLEDEMFQDLRYGVRMLLKNVPIKLVASLHDTSAKMIEKHYAKYITEHSDDVSRHALLHHEPPAADNVVALAR